jgi:ribosomal protein S18 acetylase RimI-like enzyme
MTKKKTGNREQEGNQMICECVFNDLAEKAQKYKYSSMQNIDYESCRNADSLVASDEFILLEDKNETPTMLYFAVDHFEILLAFIEGIQGDLRLHFVPHEYASHLEKLGFTKWCEWIDFFNYDLAGTVESFGDSGIIEYLHFNECSHVSEVSRQCKLQTRGFEGESQDWFEKWLSENKVIIIRNNSMIVGYCCVAIYNEGTILWIREIAVDPAYQGAGLGKKLMEQALRYGFESGAVKGFLASDSLNENAIRLYERYGFRAKDTVGELQMVRLTARE